MELIEADEVAEFRNILLSNSLSVADFCMVEANTTDPKSDELYPLQGNLTVLCASSGKSRQYAIGDGTAWLRLLRRDVEIGVFRR
ncbi:transcriptional regulator [Massilia sp. BJB1822]|uniref:transcriptional regulator n=1 Tax=Massilia sp. BJB1822 TaxID=2744470 RepID=UPI0015938015|nr:transcriptional regulator [Massilia sp. BJB1822]NVE00647.1 transcriptional regulator [Massilia sp. BJB1822]